MMKKQKLLILLMTTNESADHNNIFYTFQELSLFLIKYSFILYDNTIERKFFKRVFYPHGEIFFQNSNGARYLDPKYSRWLSTDPALSSYVEKNYNGPSGGIYNSVNLNLYHYGGNNPIRYVDPDGREVTLPAIWFDFGQSGFRTGAPQQYAGFGDWMDTAGKVLGFDLDAISIQTENFTLRLWKGNYAGAAQLGEKIADIMGYKGVSTLLSFVGGSGGEIGFYNNDDKGLFGGSSMTPDQLSSIGLVSTEILVINKKLGKVVGLRKESSPSFWTTVFNWFDFKL